MKKVICLFFIFPTFLFSTPLIIEDLPWISAVDEDTLKYTAPFLPENPIILEAGVCNASDTLCMLKLWPTSTIYGFEPNPDMFFVAQKRTEHFENVFLYPLALFDRIGKITFYKSERIPAASSLLFDNIEHIDIPEEIPHSGGNYQDAAITVDCTTVDSWSEETGVNLIDYIWLDAEGAELQILQNAKKILPTVRVISVEVNFREFRLGMTQFPELYAFLTENGFKIKYIWNIWGHSNWQATAIFVNASLVD